MWGASESGNGTTTSGENNLHVRAEVRVLKDDARVVTPGSPKVGGSCALDCRMVDNVPIGIVTRPARGCDPPGANSLSRW
jgi:hypothetical protein